jgi:hypothetical protein
VSRIFIALFLALIPQLASASTLTNADMHRQIIVEYLGTPTPDGYWTSVGMHSSPNIRGYEYGFISGRTVTDGYDFDTQPDELTAIYHEMIDTVAVAPDRETDSYITIHWDRWSCPINEKLNVLFNWYYAEEGFSVASFNGTDRDLFYDLNQKGQWKKVPAQRSYFDDTHDFNNGVVMVRTEAKDDATLCGLILWYPQNIK